MREIRYLQCEKIGLYIFGVGRLILHVRTIAIWRFGEDRQGSNSSEDARSLQQPLSRRVVGTTGVGGLVERDF